MNKKKLEKYLFPTLCLSVFIFIAFLYKSGLISELDDKITLSIYNFFELNFITKVFKFISNYTIGEAYGVLFISLFFLLTKKFTLFTQYILSVVFVASLNFIAKVLIMRPRPFRVIESLESIIVEMPKGFSLPSGHSTLAFFTAYFLSITLKFNLYQRILIFLLAFLVALSRIYLGVHYFFDTIAGIFFGMFLAQICILIIEQIEKRRLLKTST